MKKFEIYLLNNVIFEGEEVLESGDNLIIVKTVDNSKDLVIVAKREVNMVHVSGMDDQEYKETILLNKSKFAVSQNQISNDIPTQYSKYSQLAMNDRMFG